MNGNSVTVVGNITRDPELRFTASGQATASFGLAVNRVWNDRQTNEKKEAVSFFDIVCWREMAENASESLSKGARVLVTGRLEQRSWETPEGEKRTVVEMQADEVGPSLKYATAQVTKAQRGGGGGFGGGSQGGQGGGGQGGQSAGQGGQGGQRSTPEADPWATGGSSGSQQGGGQQGGGQQGGNQQGGGWGGGPSYDEPPF